MSLHLALLLRLGSISFATASFDEQCVEPEQTQGYAFVQKRRSSIAGVGGLVASPSATSAGVFNGNAIEQVVHDTRVANAHDEMFNECDSTKPEPPTVLHCNASNAMSCDGRRNRFPFTTRSKVIVDIGGNIGEDTYVMVGQNPSAKIYTFEPIPKFFEQLQDRFKLSNNPNATNVILRNAGVSNGTSQAEFILDGAGTTGVDHNTQGEHVQVNLLDIHEVLTEIQQQTGQVPDLLNMNCEGCEYAVLSRMLEKGWLEKVPFISLSWHIGADIEDRVGQRCKIEERLWQSHRRKFKAIYGWIGWELDLRISTPLVAPRAPHAVFTTRHDLT